MPKPTTIANIPALAKLLNAALAAEFETKQPFTENPNTGEFFGIYVAKEWSRVDMDIVAVEGEIWLIKGYEKFTELSEEQIELAAWLEHSFPTLSAALMGQKSFVKFAMGNYTPSLAEYPMPGISFTPSAKLQNAEQKAPWLLTVRVPCVMLLAINQCL